MRKSASCTVFAEEVHLLQFWITVEMRSIFCNGFSHHLEKNLVVHSVSDDLFLSLELGWK
jgi:hypothetical protein